MIAILNKIREILLPLEFKQASFLFALLLCGTLLEIMSVGLVIPAIATMTQPDLAKSYPQLEPLLRALGNPSQIKLIGLGMAVLVGFYILKTVFLTCMVWKQNKFAYGLQASISARLFRGYIQQPWAFHLQRNSAGLILNVTNEVNLFISMVLQPVLLLLAEGSVLVGMLILLAVFEPLGTLVTISIFGSAIFVFQMAARPRVLRWGQLRQAHDALRIKSLQQGLGAVKDVKLLGREKDFLEQYELHNKVSATTNQKQRTVTDVPRLWIEFFAVLALGILVFVMVLQGKPLALFMPTLGLFAASAFRIMPSLSRLLSGVQNLRYGLPVLQRLPEELRVSRCSDVVSDRGNRMLFDSDLVLNSVQYQYPGASRPVLQNMNLTIKRGMSVGFVGASGAGKSTLIDIVLGLLEPTKGQIRVDGINIQEDLRAWQNCLGYVPQSIYLTDDTLRRNIAFGISEEHINDDAVARAMSAAQLDGFVSELPEGLNTIVGERGVRLSGGQQQRIGIARALYHDPKVLVLDEATSALDTATEKAVMKAVNALHGEKTLLIIAHRLSTVANCDWIYKMQAGRVIAEGGFGQVVGDDSFSSKESRVVREVDSITK